MAFGSDPSTYGLLVLVIMLGAAACVLVAYSVSRLWTSYPDTSLRDPPPEQVEYMRAARHRNMLALYYEARRPSKDIVRAGSSQKQGI
jgi:hypothetical protein